MTAIKRRDFKITTILVVIVLAEYAAGWLLVGLS
jgi:uncharacterized membrane protein YciS (DUF1049 family)